MIEERKISAALKVDASQIQLPDDLLERINRQADGPAPERPPFWTRLRLGSALEVAAVCILVAGLLGIAALRNMSHDQAPTVGGEDTGDPSTTVATPTYRMLSGGAQDEVLRVNVVVDHPENGDWHLFTDIQNVSDSTVALKHDCNKLMRLEGSLVMADCVPHPDVILEPGETKREALTIPGWQQREPTRGYVDYLIRSEGMNDPVHWVTVLLAPGLPSASDVTKAYFSGYPGAGEPLHQSVAAKVLGWLHDAPVVGVDEGSLAHRGRDFYLMMELGTDERVIVRLAEDCEVTKAADGTRATCRRAEGQVNFITATGQHLRLRSTDTADWLLGQAANPAPRPMP